MSDAQSVTVDRLGKNASIEYAKRQENLRETQEFLQDAKFQLQNQELSSLSPAASSEVYNLVFPKKNRTWALLTPPLKGNPFSVFSRSGTLPSLGSDIQETIDLIQPLPASPEKDLVMAGLDQIRELQRITTRCESERDRYHKG